MKTNNPANFRLWPENAERIAYARSIGLNASEIVNKLLAKHLKPFIEGERTDKAKQFKAAISQPIP